MNHPYQYGYVMYIEWCAYSKEADITSNVPGKITLVIIFDNIHDGRYQFLTFQIEQEFFRGTMWQN